MVFALTICGQLLLLLSSLWMLKRWLPSDDKPGWHSAAFCSGLLITSFAASSLIAQFINMTPMFWFEQLGLYAAFPLLTFVLSALAFKIDWPKEAWGRILLGVCGIYWLCQQTQQLDNLLLISSILSLIMASRIVMQAEDQLCIKQKVLFFICVLLALSLVIYATLIDQHRTSLVLALAALLYTINRSLFVIDSRNRATKKI